ncbi:MAG: Beta-galactosidase BglY, partial [Pseudomonadota bacterium]
TFTDWSQIHTGIWHLHPLHLDWKRYCTTLHAACLRNEIAAVRAHSRHPVTTNLMGLSNVVDSWRLAPELDVVSLDSYPSYHETPGMADAALQVSFTHDLFRTLKGGRPYLLMEMAPSPTNTMAVPKLKRPGIHRLEALQAVAHGADSVQYFQWRKNRAGCEKFHGAVVDHAGRSDTRVFAEVAALGAELEALRDVVGTTAPAEVAIIHDWESRWALEAAQGPKRPDKGFIETCLDHYRPFWQAGVTVDVIESAVPLDRYRLVVAPMLYLLKPGVAESLRRFVAGGGTLVATYLSGITDRHDRCLLGGWPGDGLREVFGVWAEELDCLYDADRLEVRAHGAASPFTGSYAARHYADRLRLQGATAMAVYDGQFYAGEPAVTCNRFGAGEAWYVGSRNDRRFQAELAAHLIARLGLRRALPTSLPDGVTAQVRGDGREEFLFLLNWSGRPQTVDLGAVVRDAIDGTPAGPQLALDTHGARVLRRMRS